MKIRKFNSNPRDVLSFKLLKIRCQELQTAAYNKYMDNLEHTLTGNPKFLWSFVKRKRNGKSTYPAEMVLGDKTVTEGGDICNLFASHFASVYNCANPRAANDYLNAPNLSNQCLGPISFTKDQVHKVLKRLDLYKGAGADGIPSIFVARCADVLACPLSLIFNKSLRTGTFPSLWKVSLVLPLHKAGHKSQIDNYRPISILPTFGKIFESMLRPIFAKQFQQTVSLHQHGFVRARSTATNMVSFMDDLSDSLDRRKSVDVIYTDFSKAFDRVNHYVLLSKLPSIGITGILLNWCKSYLNYRKSMVVVNGYKSDPFDVLSGVPQGSILGPIFFNIFINDIYLRFGNSKCYLFADDLKILRQIDTPNDVLLLQKDLNNLDEWCNENGMSLNTKKCVVVHFNRNKVFFPREYTIRSENLSKVNCIRDLGVTMDTKLRFNAHIDDIVSKAYKTLGFVLRNCKEFKRPQTKILLFNALVRSGLEYCSVVWNPHYDVYVKKLERVQKIFLWHLTFSLNLAKKLHHYEDRLRYFNMNTLKDRRSMLDSVFLYKLTNNIFDCPDLLSRVNLNVPTKLPRKSRYNLFVTKSSKSNLGLFSPLNRMFSQYNSLSKSTNFDIYADPLSKLKSICLGKV